MCSILLLILISIHLLEAGWQSLDMRQKAAVPNRATFLSPYTPEEKHDI